MEDKIDEKEQTPPLSLPDLQLLSINSLGNIDDVDDGIVITSYTSESQMEAITKLISADLSEPYSIYTYRYFIHSWPQLCLLAYDGDECVGVIVCKSELTAAQNSKGYIAMLAIAEGYRRRHIATRLVLKVIDEMIKLNCIEICLETEVTNISALRFYEKLGFVRQNRLFRYYLNGGDAFRLKLWLQ